MMKKAPFLLLAITGMLGTAHAQTTLSGDHIITGDLNVGTSGARGNLEITGETGGSANPGIRVTGDGGVLFQGNSGQGKIPFEGFGTSLFMWYPKKAALRVGDTGWWDAWADSNVGLYSVAIGNSTSASGEASIAMGMSTYANARSSLTLGEGTTANGVGSIAGGQYSYTNNDYSVAIGYAAQALGRGSVAMGNSPFTGGAASIALGDSVIASGVNSVAIGKSNYAWGDRATAMGGQTIADAYNSFAIGRYNVGGGAQTVWEENDPLFEIGNGTGIPSDLPDLRNRNAFTVYKSGKIKMERQGDILMGEFGDPE